MKEKSILWEQHVNRCICVTCRFCIRSKDGDLFRLKRTIRELLHFIERGHFMWSESRRISTWEVAGGFQTLALQPRDMGRVCLYPHCNNTKILHALPSDRIRARLWLQPVGLRLNASTFGKYVRSLHFKPECYVSFGLVNSGYGGRLILNINSVTPAPRFSLSQQLPVWHLISNVNGTQR